MDQIFDRLERLFKSWVTQDTDGTYTDRRRPSGDSDFDDAMGELDDFLDRDRAAAEERTRERERREREARARAESEARNRGQGRQGGGTAGGPPAVVLEAFRTLGLPYGAPMKDVKASYKRLLLRYHPDRNSASTEEQKRATEISARINNAYQVIETWMTTGSVPKE